uniref:Uncharacterized protein n=1 Tax=Anguilla anguilla TaxID=7936 RepID=A0A0E9TYE8_ANGAN
MGANVLSIRVKGGLPSEAPPPLFFRAAADLRGRGVLFRILVHMFLLTGVT